MPRTGTLTVDAGMRNRLILGALLLVLPCCNPNGGDGDGGGAGGGTNAGDSGSPILPAVVGQRWVYQVSAEVLHSDGRKEKRSIERVRTFIGKVEVDRSGKKFDCFEITDGGAPVSRELAQIEPGRVLTCGSLSLANPNEKPILLKHPVPFVRRGLKGGEDLPEIRFTRAGQPDVYRKIRVVGPETVDVRAGRFETLKLRFTGKDGELGIRRLVWFAEGFGIVKEEKERFTSAGVLAREVHELTAIENAGD